jgi:hypothetical protein
MKQRKPKCQHEMLGFLRRRRKVSSIHISLPKKKKEKLFMNMNAANGKRLDFK